MGQIQMADGSREFVNADTIYVRDDTIYIRTPETQKDQDQETQKEQESEKSDELDDVSEDLIPDEYKPFLGTSSNDFERIKLQMVPENTFYEYSTKIPGGARKDQIFS